MNDDFDLSGTFVVFRGTERVVDQLGDGVRQRVDAARGVVLVHAALDDGVEVRNVLDLFFRRRGQLLIHRVEDVKRVARVEKSIVGAIVLDPLARRGRNDEFLV